jgi:hypothetical protein
MGTGAVNTIGVLTPTTGCGSPSKGETVSGNTAALILLAHQEQLSGPWQTGLSSDHDSKVR